MLLTMNQIVACRCAFCGHMALQEMSLFCLKDYVLRCDCGETCAHFVRRGNRLHIQVTCFLCDEEHRYQESLRIIHHTKLRSFFCAETEFPLLFLGERHAVEQAVSEADCDFEELSQSAGFFQVLDTVLLKNLDHIHDIALEGRLTCSCNGTHITMQVQEDTILLCCNDCGATKKLSMATPEDCAYLQELDEIIVDSDKKEGEE